jgi:hypothetical protein
MAHHGDGRRCRPSPTRSAVQHHRIVDDQPTLVHDWLPEMAALVGGPAPRHVPALRARLVVGGWGVAYMTGLAADLGVRAP